ALAFSAGVLLSFLLLGAIMLSLKSAGLAAGWGFQLQSPVFVTAMALLFVAIGLNLAGMFEIGLGLTQLARLDVGPGGRNQEGPRWLANAGSGALAVLVATPCTAPFMASALGFTLSASAVEALAVFVAIGLGMALPYLLLGWFPGWLRWLPKPGRWMESLRQALAFPMFITAAWLAWVLGQQAGIDAVLALAVGAIMIAFGAGCLGRFVQPRGFARARLATLLAIASLAGGLWLALSKADPVISGESSVRSSSVATSSVATSSGALGLHGGASQSTGVDATASTAAWQTWSPQRVTEALAAGRPVFVDFTAAWCVSCQANKKLVLDRDGIVKAMADRGVLRLRADWTQRDPAITAELARHGRSGVPLYLLFEPASRAPRVLPELLTTGMVLEAMAAIPTRR
ncbi:MAG: protein-disulfide reductase DsbD family protein, partial [Betaproteobacteria bacterium]